MKGSKVGLFQKVGLGLLAFAPFAAFAQTTYDTSALTSAATDAATAILAVGAAIVAGPRIAVKVWKWIGRAL